MLMTAGAWDVVVRRGMVSGRGTTRERGHGCRGWQSLTVLRWLTGARPRAPRGASSRTGREADIEGPRYKG